MDQFRPLLLLSFAAIAVSVFFTVGPAAANDAASPPAPGPWDQQSSWNMDLVGYNDLQGRSTYQPLVIHQGDREIAYMAHHAGTGLNPLDGQTENNGTSIVDVTDPKNPNIFSISQDLPGR
jgi:hypothetical protein